MVKPHILEAVEAELARRGAAPAHGSAGPQRLVLTCGCGDIPEFGQGVCASCGGNTRVYGEDKDNSNCLPCWDSIAVDRQGHGQVCDGLWALRGLEVLPADATWQPRVTLKHDHGWEVHASKQGACERCSAESVLFPHEEGDICADCYGLGAGELRLIGK